MHERLHERYFRSLGAETLGFIIHIIHTRGQTG